MPPRAHAMGDCVWYRYVRIIRNDFARIHCPRHACHLFTLNRLIKLWSFPSLSSPPCITPRHVTKINPESVGTTEDDTFDRYEHVPKTNSPLIDVMCKRVDEWISFRGFARVKENRHNLNTGILMARKRSFILFIVLVLCGKISHEMMVGFNWNWTAWLTVELKLYITGSNSQAKKIFCGKSRVINRRNDRT